MKKYPPKSIIRAKEQLINHDLIKAMKTMRNGNISVDNVADELNSCIEWLYNHKSYGVILSAYYRFGNCANYGINELLKKMYEIGDYPSFLKQAYRFDAYDAFISEIEIAIAWHEERKFADSKAWRRKFVKLSETSESKFGTPNQKEMTVLEETDNKSIDTEIYLKIIPIKKRLKNEIVHLELEPEEDPYIISRTSRKKLEHANQVHENTVRSLKQCLIMRNLKPSETKLIDTFCILNSGPAIFEIKSITEENEREQIRHAISQLYEYRFLHSLPEASLWIVFSEKPFSQWYIEYLTKDRHINVIWLENEQFLGPAAILLH